MISAGKWQVCTHCRARRLRGSPLWATVVCGKNLPTQGKRSANSAFLELTAAARRKQLVHNTLQALARNSAEGEPEDIGLSGPSPPSSPGAAFARSVPEPAEFGDARAATPTEEAISSNSVTVLHLLAGAGGDGSDGEQIDDEPLDAVCPFVAPPELDKASASPSNAPRQQPATALRDLCTAVLSAHAAAEGERLLRGCPPRYLLTWPDGSPASEKKAPTRMRLRQ